jgi:hypothetical protein
MANQMQGFRGVKWGVISVVLLILLLFSCQSPSVDQAVSWKTYRNPRYHFECPYPSQWIPAPMPDNRDGRAFSDPRQPAAEMRGWASQRLLIKGKNSLNALDPAFSENFTTLQGIGGNLQIEVGVQMSLMTLTLIQGTVQYSWQGRSPSQQFADYYRLFYYVASRYRIPKK